MKNTISAVAFAMLVSTAAFAQQPSPTSSDSAQLLRTLPTNGTTVTNYYKQDVYDRSDSKIGTISDVLVDREGRVTAVIVGVGGFLGMQEKDVAAPFSALHSVEKNNKSYLVMNATKDELQNAPGYTYDKTKTTWTPTKL
jgi:sporulation protein YlmC with PRC-barrel domain